MRCIHFSDQKWKKVHIRHRTGWSSDRSVLIVIVDDYSNVGQFID
jgi:hypothetical protein